MFSPGFNFVSNNFNLGSYPLPKLDFETCLLMLSKIRKERESGLYESIISSSDDDMFKGFMFEFEKSLEALVGSYMVLLTIFSYQQGQERFA